MKMNATELLNSLDADQIRQRLKELRDEKDALKVLLRAAIKKDQESGGKGAK